MGLWAKAGRSVALITASTVGGTYSSFPPKLRLLTTSSWFSLEGGLHGSMGTEYSANLTFRTMLLAE
jgi:hypothetical protein